MWSVPEGGHAQRGCRRLRRQRSWLRDHSLIVVIGGILLTWFLLYWHADPTTHLGACYGNASVCVTVNSTARLQGTAASAASFPILPSRYGGIVKTLAVCSDAAMSERSTRPALQRLSLSAGDHQSLRVVHFGTGVL